MTSPDRPHMVLVAGANGSGKTSFMRESLSREWFDPDAWINSDEIAQRLGSWNDPECIRRASVEAGSRMRSLLDRRKSFAFETVLSVYPRKFFRKALELGFSLHVIYLGTRSPEINAARVMRRFMQGGHTVPIEKIGTRHLKSLENALKVAAVADAFHLYDASEEGPPTRRLTLRKGVVVWQNAGAEAEWVALFRERFPERIEDPETSHEEEWMRPAR